MRLSLARVTINEDPTKTKVETQSVEVGLKNENKIVLNDKDFTNVLIPKKGRDLSSYINYLEIVRVEESPIGVGNILKAEVYSILKEEQALEMVKKSLSLKLKEEREKIQELENQLK